MGGAGWLWLDSPLWLCALPLAAGPILLALWGRRRGRLVAIWAVAVQCLAIALTVAALAGPKAALGAKAGLPCLLFTDASGSVRGQQDLAPALLREFPPAWSIARFDFAAGLTARPTGGQAEAGGWVNPAATEIAPVLRMIASPAAGGVAVIATDGRFTDEHWESLASAVASAKADLVLVPMARPAPDARIASLSARRRGDQVELSATVVANAPVQHILTIRRGGRSQPLLVRPLSLLADSPATVPAADALAPEASAEYSASLSPPDLFPENDSAGMLVPPVRGRLAAVAMEGPTRGMLGGLPQPIDYLLPLDLPDQADRLAGFSAILLCDPTGQAFSPAQRRALGEYVSAGGGLVMLGTGPHQSPADQQDPLNRALPLLANPFQRRPLRLTVLLDRSGSMSWPAERRASAPAQIKFDLAAEATLALKDHLTPRDSLAVIAFADRPETVYDSGDGPADFAALRQALRGAQPAGSTHVTPAIEAALARPPEGGRTPMLLVVSDLQTVDFKPDVWADHIRQAKAELAIVAVSDGASTQPAEGPPPLETLARLTNAPYVRRDDLAGLAKVFATLVRGGRGSAIRAGRTALAVVGPLFDSGVNALPDAEAYVLSATQTSAELLARTQTGDPVIARMQYGLGRSVSVALPSSPTQNAAWQGAPEGGKLLSAAARWAMRGDNDPRFDAVLRRQGGELNIAVTARRDGEPINLLHLSAELAIEGTSRAVELQQAAPGRYEAAITCPAHRPVAVAIRSDGAVVWHGASDVLYPQEYAALGLDPAGLQRLADLTGGRIVPAERLGEALGQSFAGQLTTLWPFLVSGALGLMLMEWCLTRLTRR